MPWGKYENLLLCYVSTLFRIGVSSGDMHSVEADADCCKRYSDSATDFSLRVEFEYSGSRECALREAFLSHEGAMPA